VPELARTGARPPVHAPADHQPGAQTGAQVQIDEGVARAGDRQTERGGIGVLVDGDGHPEPPHEGVPQREAVPLGEAGDPVQHAPCVVERSGQCHTHPHEGVHPRERSRPVRVPVRCRGREHLGRQRLGLRGHPLHDRLRPGREVQRRAPFRGHGPVQVDQHGPQLVPVGVHPHGVPGLRYQPQHGRRLAPGGSPASRLGRQAPLPQPRGDLAHRLRGQAGALGEFLPADALGTGPPQQVQHQRGVVAAQGEQVRPGAPAARRARHPHTARRSLRPHAARRADRTAHDGPGRVRPVRGAGRLPRVRRADHTPPAVRGAGRICHAHRLLPAAHAPIVPRACTSATALRKWEA